MQQRIAAILALDVADFSRLMADDHTRTIKELNRILREVVRPEIERHSGRLFKLLGDGALAEFPSASAAIVAGHSIQRDLAQSAIKLRGGIHVGDITEQGGDRFGDAINIAARLQAEAPPGGLFISQIAAHMAGGNVGVGMRSEGTRRLKNIERPIEILSIGDNDDAEQARYARFAREQQIRFVTSRDGTRLAWSTVGEGRPVIKAPNWIQHLEIDWQSYFAAMLGCIASNHRLIRFDQRGNGLSDWDVQNISLDHFVEDLTAVFDAAGIDRAPIFAISQGSAIAAKFAALHPERVSGILMIGGFAQGRARRSCEPDREAAEALRTFAHVGWDDEYPSIRDHLARMIIPDASHEDHLEFAGQMKSMISAENFLKFREAVDDFDVTDILPDVQCPTLVLHSRRDRLQPIEQGRLMAASIPNARFTAIDSRSHDYPSYDPAWPVVRREIVQFFDEVS